MFQIMRDTLGQCILNFFAPWTPKSQNDFHGPLESFLRTTGVPLNSIKEV